MDKSPANWVSLTFNVFEHLLEIDAQGNLVPRLATGWRWLSPVENTDAGSHRLMALWCTATTFQALEMTNGATLDQTLRAASARLVSEVAKDPAEWVEETYRTALARQATDAERKFAL